MATETDFLGGDGDLYIELVAAEVMLVGETSADQLSVWREEEKIAFISGGREGESGESGGRKQKLNQSYFFQLEKIYAGRGKNLTWRQESRATNDDGSGSKSSNQLHGILPSPKNRLTSSHSWEQRLYSLLFLYFSRKRPKRVPTIVLLDSSIDSSGLWTSLPSPLFSPSAPLHHI